MSDNYLKEEKQIESFVQEVKEQLSRMSEKDKDQWILNQAVILSTSKQQDFMKTLTHDKIALNIPNDEEFYQFCDNVKEEKVYIEYKTWYQEFDDYGFYQDDWEEEFYDSCHVLSFIDKVFEACRNFNKLGYYNKTCEYMNALNQLEIPIIETENSDDFYGGTLPFTVDVAYEHFLLHHNKKNVAYNWILAYCQMNQSIITNKVNDLLNLFCERICDKVLPSDFECMDHDIYQLMLKRLEDILADDLSVYKKKYPKEDYFSDEQYILKVRIEREEQLIDDLKSIL